MNNSLKAALFGALAGVLLILVLPARVLFVEHPAATMPAVGPKLSRDTV